MKAIRRMDDFKTRDGRHEDLSGYEETDIYGATEGRSPFRLSGKRAASGSLIQKERPYGRSFYFSKFLVDYSALLTSRSCDFCSIWLR